MFLIGLFIVLLCVFGGYAAMGGKLYVLWQPWEVVIICGAALGAFIIANPGYICKGVMKNIGKIFKGMPYKKDDYIELMQFLNEVFKVIHEAGGETRVIKADVENPHDSDMFNKYPKFAHDHHAVDFFCDHMSIIMMGVSNHYQMDDLMTEDLDSHHHDCESISGAVTAVADGLPAIGIVAAVLGVIKTMGVISEPPEVIGKYISGALVGTFLGVFIAYTIVGPIAQFLGRYFESQSKYLSCIKIGIIMSMQGYDASISVEAARRTIPEHLRPTFEELKELLAE